MDQRENIERFARGELNNHGKASDLYDELAEKHPNLPIPGALEPWDETYEASWAHIIHLIYVAVDRTFYPNAADNIDGTLVALHRDRTLQVQPINRNRPIVVTAGLRIIWG